MILRFADCELDIQRFSLCRAGQPVPVQPRVLDLIVHLARAGDRVVTHRELCDTVWGGVAVSESAVRFAIKEARRALGDDGAEQRLIATVRSRGFRFLAPVVEEPDAGGSVVAPRDLFVGRRDVLVALEAELAASRSDAVRLVLLEGEPGIGKSRILLEVAGRARARGFRVLSGRSVEELGAPAYWPWTQLLRPLLDGAAPSQLPAPSVDAIARVLPDLRPLLPSADERSQPDPPDARETTIRLYDAVCRVVAAATADSPLALLLDDLHRADPGTVALLDHLVRELDRVPLLLVASSRSGPPSSDPELERRHRELVCAPRTRMLTLSGLAPAEVAELVSALSGRAPGAAELAELMQRTGGNPFFVRAIAAFDPGTTVGARELPATVSHAVLRHLDATSDMCRALLARAAVLGQRFELDALVALVDTPVASVLAELDRAVAVRVLEPNEGSPAQFHFVHALIREALIGTLPAAELRALHIRAAQVLDAAGDTNARTTTRIAQHLLAGVPAVDSAVAIAACRRAAQEARHRSAHEEEASWLARAVELGFAVDFDEPARLELLLELAEAQLVALQVEEARGTCARAVEIARRRSSPESLARAALVFAGEQDDARLDPTAVGLLEESVHALGPGDSALRARVRARLAEAIYRGPELERAATLCRNAVAMARRCGEQPTLASVLKAQFWTTWSPENLDEREAISNELRDVSVASGRPPLELEALSFQLCCAVERGDRARVEDRFRALDALAKRSGRILIDWPVEHYRAMLRLLDGDTDAAEDALEHAHQLGCRTRYELASTWYGIQLYGLRRDQGRLTELEPMMRQMARDYPMTPWPLALACEDARLGRTDEVRGVLCALTDDGLSRVRRDLDFLPTLWYLAELCLLLGAAVEARAVERALLPFADRHVAVGIGMLYLGPVSQSLAALAAAQGHVIEAARWHVNARASDLRGAHRR